MIAVEKFLLVFNVSQIIHSISSCLSYEVKVNINKLASSVHHIQSFISFLNCYFYFLRLQNNFISPIHFIPQTFLYALPYSISNS